MFFSLPSPLDLIRDTGSSNSSSNKQQDGTPFYLQLEINHLKIGGGGSTTQLCQLQLLPSTFDTPGYLGAMGRFRRVEHVLVNLNLLSHGIIKSYIYIKYYYFVYIHDIYKSVSSYL